MKLNFKKIIILSLLFLMVEGVFAAGKKTMYVAVENVTLKAKASVTAKNVGDLVYGETVQIVNEKSSWVEVVSLADSSVRGWVNSNTLTSKKIIAGNKKVSTDASEIALAGKGFNATIEAEFSKAEDLSFEAVDSIENNEVSLDETIEFITEGKLKLEDK